MGCVQGRNRGWLPGGAQPNFFPVSVEELGWGGYPPVLPPPPQKIIRFDPFVNYIVVILVNFIDFVFRKKIFLSLFLSFPFPSFLSLLSSFFSFLLFFLHFPPFFPSFLPVSPSFSLFPYPSFYPEGRLIFPLGGVRGGTVPPCPRLLRHWVRSTFPWGMVNLQCRQVGGGVVATPPFRVQ